MGAMMRAKLLGLLRASHFGPTVLVVSTSFALSITQLCATKSAQIALAIFCGQLVVGWTNDLLDFPRDKAADRLGKPLVVGTISETTLRRGIALALACALVFSLVSPLGLMGTAIHFLGLLSATAYNFKLKSTAFSVVPYIVSFGALPWAIYTAAGSRPPLWLVLALVLFTSAFHFFNVLKDMDVDISQKVMGLPQLIGRSSSIAIACLLTALGIVASASKYLTL